MRRKTESGNVRSSHSSACGRSSFITNARIDSRSASWSSLKMKWRRAAPWSGLKTSVAAMKWTVELLTYCRNRSRAITSALMSPTVRYDVAEHVATIALDQPETRNALSNDVLDDLIEAFEMARGDGSVRCVVLTSTHQRGV